MSLINDALKRVKAAQQQPPPSAAIGPGLKPVEAPTPVAYGQSLWLPTSLAVGAILALALVWALRGRIDLAATVPVRAQTMQSDPPANQAHDTTDPLARAPDTSLTRSASPQESILKPVTAAKTPSAPQTIDPSVAVTASHSLPPSAESNAQRAVLPQSSSVAPAPPAATAGTGSAPAAALSPLATNASPVALVTSNATPVGDAAPPKPPAMKLQGIIFDPKRPSAVINGRTVFIGDRIHGMRVVAITSGTATLVGAGHTNLLSMAE